MALFGAPIAHEDHAVRACYSALAIRENLAALGERFALRPHRTQFGRSAGSIDRQRPSIDYDAIGSTVHLASRMEQLARPGTAILTEAATARGRLREHRPARPAKRVRASAAVDCYELRDSSNARTRWEIRSALGLSRFVGRDHELAQLRNWAEAPWPAAVAPSRSAAIPASASRACCTS